MSPNWVGQVQLHPGQALAGSPGVTGPISGGRPDVVPALAPGRAAADWPALTASLFTLCAHAHKLAARLAIAAAQGQVAAPSLAERRALQAATARDQVLRIAHDWPRLLPGVAPDATPPAGATAHPRTRATAAADAALLADPVQLRACPLWRSEWTAADQLAALPDWLQHKWLGLRPADWLARHAQAPQDWPLAYARQTATPLARLLAAQLPVALALPTRHLPLDLLDQPALTLGLLARQITLPGFCREPNWQNEVPDTGPWTRHHAPQRLPADSAGARLIARLADLLQLADAQHGAHWLDVGALALGDGRGLAWVEMSRGLLIHWVRLAPDAATPTLADARVLAPTEWNFHPQGVLARALAALPAGRPEQAEPAARRLAVAFDPCMPFTVAPGPAPTHPHDAEPDHA